MVNIFLKFLSKALKCFLIYNLSIFLSGYYCTEMSLIHVKDLLFINCVTLVIFFRTNKTDKISLFVMCVLKLN